ncbi:MAG: transporter substrate-binding domain-containing protein [Pseudomonadota bacterium]
MNRRRALLLALLGAQWAVAQGGTLTVTATGHPGWPPYSWQHEDTIVGVGAELAQRILAELGITVRFRPSGNWKRAQAEVQAGNVDLLVAAYRTDERRRTLLFPATPFAADDNVLWVAKGREFAFDKWEDLVGKRGTAMLGESYGQAFDTYIARHLQVERVSTALQNLQKLALGRADYYPFSLHGGQIQVNQLGFTGKIEHLPTVVSSEGVYLAISNKSALAPYLPRIEAVLARMRADGTLEQLMHKYVALAAAQ